MSDIAIHLLKDTAAKRPFFEDLFGWLLSNLAVNPDWTVLEFGVGSAGFATLYKETFKRVLGLDIYDYSKHHPGVEFVLSDGRTIPLPDETVDLVVSHSVLEHVGNLEQSIREMDRVLTLGGFAFLSVSPLYFAATGSHVNHPKTLSNWEHLDPASEYYMLENPIGGTGDYLNKLTSAKILAAIGGVPWDILRYEVRTEATIAPDWIDRSSVSTTEIYVREFRLLAQRRTRLAATGPVQLPPLPYVKHGVAPGEPRVALVTPGPPAKRPLPKRILDRVWRTIRGT